MKKEIKGNLLLLLTAMIWGLAFVAQSEAMDHIGPFTMQAIRSALAGLVMLPVIALRDRSGLSARLKSAAERKKYLVTGCICGIFLFLASTLQQIGLIYTSVGKSGFLTALYVILVPVLGIFLRKKAALIVWLGVVLAILGLYFLCLTDRSALNIGDILTLLCSVAFALHIVYIDHACADLDGVRISCIQFFFTSFVASICMIAFETPSWDAIRACMVAILYTGILSGGAGYTLQIIGQRYTNPTVASLIMSLESVFAAVFGWLILSQGLSGRELLGCGLMFAAIILAQLPTSRKKAAA